MTHQTLTDVVTISRGFMSTTSHTVKTSTLPDPQLDPISLAGLESMRIDSLFPVQRICWELITNRLAHSQHSQFDCDLCVSAPTGSGKSLAYILPIINGLPTGRSSAHLRALIVLPTRDLALQVSSVASKFGVRVQALVGQHSIAEERGALSAGADIAVATMGRLMDHLVIGSLDLSALRWLVVDEADRMLSKSDLDKWSVILESVPKETQRLLFSATMTENPMKLNKLKLTRPLFVSLGGQSAAGGSVLPTSITHKFVVAPNKSLKVRCTLRLIEMLFAPPAAADALIESPCRRCLVFCRTAANVESLTALLKAYCPMLSPPVAVEAVSGNMNGKAREKTLAKFGKMKIQILVATDVITRGIDIPDIDVVVNYDVPLKSTTYVHRAGRTGRAGKVGFVLSVAESKEMRHFRQDIVKPIHVEASKISVDFSTVISHKQLEQLTDGVSDGEISGDEDSAAE